MKKIVLVLAVLLVLVSACKNPFLKKMLVEEEKGESSAVPKHTVTFSVEGGHGTLKAKADGVEETAKSPISIEQGKKVTFTAEPAAPYVVKEWKVDGIVVTGNTENSYIHTVTKAVDVKVSFDAPFVEGGASLILSPNKLVISVKAVTSDGSAVAVEGCTETELTSGTVTVLHAKGTRVILKGKITALGCDNNQLTALNVQGLTALQGLDCHINQLTALNVQGLTALQGLDCLGNQLTELNVQGLTALQYLSCAGNRLTALNVQGLTALKKLYCHNNQFTALNVQGLTALEELYCYNNQLTALNVQGLTALKKLYCHNNQLTELNVQGLTTLQTLNCWGNQLTELNVQGCTALQSLVCGSNQLTELNVQGLTALERLNCYNNQLTALNVQGLTALNALWCYSNKLNADAFKKLFDDLPVRADSDDAKCYLYTEETGVSEGNHTDFTAPPDLAAAFNNAKNNKKWKMCKWNGSGSWVEI